MEKNRVASLSLAVIASLLFGWAGGHAGGILRAGSYVFVSALIQVPILAMIWFSDEIGSYSGPSSDGPMVPTPGIILRIFGWLLLVMTFFASCNAALHPEQILHLTPAFQS